MNYIKDSRKKYAIPVGGFFKLEQNFTADTGKEDNNETAEESELQRKLQPIVNSSLDSDKQLSAKVIDKIRSLEAIDWYKKDSIQSQMRLEIYNIISKESRFIGKNGKLIASKIVNDIIDMLNQEETQNLGKMSRNDF